MENVSFDLDVKPLDWYMFCYPNISFITIATIFSKINGTKIRNRNDLIDGKTNYSAINLNMFTYFLQQFGCFELDSVVVLLLLVRQMFELHYLLPIQLE